MSNIARPLSRRLKAASKPRPQGRRQRPNVELLEERQLLATVQWISTTGGNWDDAANWSTGQVPGTGDDVVIDVSGATPTITIDSTTQASVNSVECSDPLAIAGGSLSVAASSTISGGLAMTVGGSLTASGSGVTLSVTGTTTASDSSLYVENGATLNLPQLTTYAIPDPSYACSFEATGSGSVLNLQGLDSLGTLLSPLYVEVSGGAEVLMSSLPSIDTGNLADVSVDADGSGSQINLSGLTSFTGGQLEATNGATVILNASLTRLTGVTITVDANSTLPLSQWTSLIDDSLNMDGGSYVLSSLTDIDSSSLVVQYGGSLSLPGITSYSNPLAGTTFEADGAGSMLSLPALTSLNQLQSATSIDAQQGGQTLLPSLTSIDTSQSNQQVFVQSDGAGAEIDLSALTSFESTNVSVLTVMHGGTILDNKLTSLTGVGVTLDGTGTLLASQWTSLIDGSLNIDGGSYTLSNLTDIDSSSLVVQSGGSLTLPAVTSYSNPLAGATFEATGAGSVLSLPALTSLTQLQNGIYIDADEGGQTLLKSVTSIDTTQSNQQVFVRADGPGSEIDLSSATSFDSVNVSTLSVTDGATLLDGMLTVLNGVDVALDGTGALATTQWTAFTGATLNLNGGELGLPSLTSADNAGFLVSGTATLTLSAASDFANSGASATLSDTAALDVGTADVTMPAPGDGATFNIPQMPEGLTIVLSPDGTYSGGTTIDASAGDSIVVANCTFTGGVVFNVGNGTTLDLPGASITGGATFNVDTGATVDLTVGETSTISGAFGGAGAGTVILNSGTLAIGIGGATFNFPGSMFQWTGGTIDGALGVLTNTNLGTINLAGPNAKGLARDGTLDDFGTIIQTGGGYLAMHSDDRAPAVVEIERGGSYLIESDAGVEISGESEIDNAGTIQKTAGTGASALTVDGTLNNTGTIEADSGTLYLDTNTITEVSANALTGGTWKAEGLANLAFPPGTAITSSAADISLDGAGATITGIAGLSSNSGSLSITNGATFTTTADFSNGGTLNVGAGSTLTVNGAFTQTSKGALDVQIGGTPASGLSGQVAVSGTATLAGAFNLAVVNDFAPSAGEDFKVMTFASASGNFTTFTGLNPFFTESLGATSLDLIDNATSAVDLAGLTVTAPITATAGQAIAVSWQATDASSQAATGSWQDSVYVSATPAITATSILLGATQHTGGLAGDGTYNSSLTAPLPALAPGNYYVLVQIDSLYQVPDPNRANNTLAAGTGELAVRLPALTLGIATQGTFAAAGQHDYYQVTVPAGGSLVVSLASTASSGAVALYVSQGTEPTPYNYQEAADVANQPDQTVTVPQVAAATTYYILAESVAGAAAMGGYSLIATQTGAVSVAAISSYSGGNAGNVTVKIDGTNFSRNTTASLSLGGAPINSASIYYQNASQIFATFDLTGAAVGSYTLNVQVGPNSATAPTKFNVVPASTGEPLSLVLSPPALVSAGRDS
ncbi:MAG: beta strand repeat-containing protein, partial [Isosphaeraceae bacterium]